jgi:hypothetical protein
MTPHWTAAGASIDMPPGCIPDIEAIFGQTHSKAINSDLQKRTALNRWQ